MLEQFYNKETNTLILPYYFNDKLSDLPNSITNLTFGPCFNQSVGHQGCNISCSRNLPNSITHLTFGYYFDQSIDKLPKNIKELGFASGNKIKNNIPENIENIEIVFLNNENDSMIENIPCHIKQIKINERHRINYLKKIPFGCKVVDEEEKEIFLE